MTYERYQSGEPTNGWTRSPNEIQSDLADIRREMDRTLADISAKLEPRELLSQLMHSFGGGSGGRLVGNLSHSLENPIPLVLIASGFGYLMYDDAQRRKHELSMGGDGSGTRMAEGAREAASTAGSRARHAGQRASQLAGQAADKAGHTAREMMHRAQEVLHEQPLVLAGLGLALGAAVAGATPLSRRERELMAGPAGEAMERVGDAARRKAQEARDAVTAAGRAAKQEMTSEQQPTEERRAAPELKAPPPRGPLGGSRSGGGENP